MVSFFVIQSAGERGNEVLKRRFFCSPLNLWFHYIFFLFFFFLLFVSLRVWLLLILFLFGLLCLLGYLSFCERDRERERSKANGVGAAIGGQGRVNEWRFFVYNLKKIMQICFFFHMIVIQVFLIFI